MVLRDQDHAQSVRDEWRRKFEDIVDGDINMLREDLKPHWRELPKRSRLDPTYVRRAREFAGTSAIENPTINPVTGRGRTSTEVEREVQAYRTHMRRAQQVWSGPAYRHILKTQLTLIDFTYSSYIGEW